MRSKGLHGKMPPRRALPARAEAQAAAQFQAMLTANPSGALGTAKLNDMEALLKSGLL